MYNIFIYLCLESTSDIVRLYYCDNIIYVARYLFKYLYSKKLTCNQINDNKYSVLLGLIYTILSNII